MVDGAGEQNQTSSKSDWPRGRPAVPVRQGRVGGTAFCLTPPPALGGISSSPSIISVQHSSLRGRHHDDKRRQPAPDEIRAKDRPLAASLSLPLILLCHMTDVPSCRARRTLRRHQNFNQIPRLINAASQRSEPFVSGVCSPRRTRGRSPRRAACGAKRWGTFGADGEAGTP